MNESPAQLIIEINKLKKENANLRNEIDELETELEDRVYMASNIIHDLKNEIKEKNNIIHGQLKQIEILKKRDSIIH